MLFHLQYNLNFSSTIHHLINLQRGAAPVVKKSKKKKMSYAVKESNRQSVAALAWFWQMSASAVVDLALDELMKSKSKELIQAQELLAIKGPQNAGS